MRSIGIAADIRKKNPYEIYSILNFSVPTTEKGDCLDRYNIRVEEMRQSLRIILQAIQMCCEGLIKTDDYKINAVNRHFLKTNMENVISHFKFYSENFTIPHAEVEIAVEAPKGENGLYLITNNTNKCYRCKIKAPGFLHLQGINKMAQKHFLADVVTIIGTQDIVFGEIDR